jgi:hypothetical protein
MIRLLQDTSRRLFVSKGVAHAIRYASDALCSLDTILTQEILRGERAATRNDYQNDAHAEADAWRAIKEAHDALGLVLERRQLWKEGNNAGN